MRNIILAAALTLVGASVAAQADTAIGRIIKVDPANDMVTLSDGRTYDFNETDSAHWLSGFLAGDAVKVNFIQSGDKLQGQAIVSTSGFQTVGKIAKIDPATYSVALENGHVFNFDQTKQAREELATFKVGDKVQIAFDRESGGVMRGRAIAGTTADEVTGVIKSVDVGGGSVTLENGKTYSFETSRPRGTELLTGYLAGDHVSIILSPDGKGVVAEAISPSMS